VATGELVEKLVGETDAVVIVDIVVDIEQVVDAQ